MKITLSVLALALLLSACGKSEPDTSVVPEQALATSSMPSLVRDPDFNHRKSTCGLYGNGYIKDHSGMTPDQLREEWVLLTKQFNVDQIDIEKRYGGDREIYLIGDAADKQRNIGDIDCKLDKL